MKSETILSHLINTGNIEDLELSFGEGSPVKDPTKDRES